MNLTRNNNLDAVEDAFSGMAIIVLFTLLGTMAFVYLLIDLLVHLPMAIVEKVRG